MNKIISFATLTGRTMREIVVTTASATAHAAIAAGIGAIAVGHTYAAVARARYAKFEAAEAAREDAKVLV